MGSKTSRVKNTAQSSVNAASKVSKQSQPQSTPKDAKIQRDGFDPHYLANLKLMGQVRVPKQNVIYSSTSPMTDVLRGRSRDSSIAETLENEPSAQLGTIDSNRISSTMLAVILDDRKKAANYTDQQTQTQQQFATSSGIDPALVERLAKHVNSISVHKEEVIKTDDHREIYTARWVDIESPTARIPPTTSS